MITVSLNPTMGVAWHRFLAGANLLQFLPCAFAITAEGAGRGLYEQVEWTRLSPAAGLSPTAGGPARQSAILAEAELARDQTRLVVLRQVAS